MDSNTEPPQVDANDLTNKLHSQLLLKHTGLHKIIIYKKNYNSRVRFYKKKPDKTTKSSPIFADPQLYTKLLPQGQPAPSPS